MSWAPRCLSLICNGAPVASGPSGFSSGTGSSPRVSSRTSVRTEPPSKASVPGTGTSFGAEARTTPPSWTTVKSSGTRTYCVSVSEPCGTWAAGTPASGTGSVINPHLILAPPTIHVRVASSVPYWTVRPTS